MSDYEVTLTVQSTLDADQVLDVVTNAVANKTGEAPNVEIVDWDTVD